MSHTNPAARRAYHRAYYHRHAVKRRAEGRYHKQAQTWCRWLIHELLTKLARRTGTALLERPALSRSLPGPLTRWPILTT